LTHSYLENLSVLKIKCGGMNNIHASQVSLFYSLCSGSAGVKENICNIGTVLLVTMYSESNQLQEVSDHLINNSLSTNWIESTLDR